jgi:hypothetical protein
MAWYASFVAASTALGFFVATGVNIARKLVQQVRDCTAFFAAEPENSAE